MQGFELFPYFCIKRDKEKEFLKHLKRNRTMKRLLFIAMFMASMPLAMMAQANDDDVYFTPKKHSQELSSSVEPSAYYSGSSRDVDEYNRRGKLKSYYQKIGTDSLGNDIIQFHTGNGQYSSEYGVPTDSIYPGSERYYEDADVDDYAYARRMGMFDGWYGWYNPYFYSYRFGPYYNSWYGWYDPWYYSSWYGYNPWYYGYGWGYPYYGWGGWYRPTYYAYHSRPVHTGTLGYYDRSNYRPGGGRYTYGQGSNSGKNTFYNNRSNATFGSRNKSTNNFNRQTYTPQRTFSTPSFGGQRSGASFGGGSSFGGNRGSIGGAHMGGRR